MFAVAPVCPACGTIAGRVKSPGSARAGGGQMGRALAPEGITAEQVGDCLTIRAKGGLIQNGLVVAYFLSLSVVLTAMVLLGFLSWLLGSSWLASTIPAAFMVGIVGTVAYTLAGGFLNRVVVEITPTTIKRHHVGPIPWPNFHSTIATDSIAQVYVVTRRVFQHRRYSQSGAWMRYFAGDEQERGFTRLVYDVNFALRGGGRRRFLTCNQVSVGRFIERHMEQHLGIRDVPVVSTWYQKVLHWETTDHDGTDREDHPAAISPGSFPIPPTALAALSAVGLVLLLPGLCMFGGAAAKILTRSKRVQQIPTSGGYGPEQQRVFNELRQAGLRVSTSKTTMVDVFCPANGNLAMLEKLQDWPQKLQLAVGQDKHLSAGDWQTLASSPNLRQLDLSKLAVPPKDLADNLDRIRQAVPNCQIIEPGAN